VKNQAFKYLEEKIKTQQDYEEIKRELKYATSIVFLCVCVCFVGV